MLAATCCLPLLEIGAAGWRGWSQLIVYPDAFRVQRTHMDAAGVMHAWDDTLIGEAWEQGPLIVSWADVQADLDDPQAGFNVIVHEMTHKLDALDGALDGSPPLPRSAQRTWARDFQHAYDLFANASMPAKTPRSTHMPPKHRKNSSRWSANITSPHRTCLHVRCRRLLHTWNVFTDPRRLRRQCSAECAASLDGVVVASARLTKRLRSRRLKHCRCIEANPPSSPAHVLSCAWSLSNFRPIQDRVVWRPEKPVPLALATGPTCESAPRRTGCGNC